MPQQRYERQRLLAEHDPLASDADRELEETFASPSDDEDSDDENGDGVDDRQRLMRGQPESSRNDEGYGGSSQEETRPRPIVRRVTQLPAFVPGGRVVGGGSGNDGVFANLSAKPSREDDVEEKPPSYEQAAADATPPYWETTILAPGLHTDEVFVDGLPVGSVFSFVWNAIISMAFQLVGFLLTYLLHTTHAAKNGARAGLGITLVQYGFTMKGASSGEIVGGTPDAGAGFGNAPKDPNNVDFDPNDVSGDGSGASSGQITTSEWLAYILMIVGWFILIRSVSDFLRARRHEQLVLQSSNRGLNVPVVAEGENPSQAV
ncbi:metal homeostatis protein bsd2 [Neofusicoccum parvum]|uniref:Metal homeostatis protein bsd2 n=2 Tax=Neofusicoccum parvum TaxID=310453 RepID=A0ACB5S166_9PEZI|nr:putative metal homeostatis protein bsd2 protein [Neofusicoccum parvum UCRNP2]GME26426.1 metal homeostatis protein bsd2 [Neofusicoccum parvum]GME42951.1 metal homeostatis protein bsd2 [Neofusicoccum parvum]